MASTRNETLLQKNKSVLMRPRQSDNMIILLQLRSRTTSKKILPKTKIWVPTVKKKNQFLYPRQCGNIIVNIKDTTRDKIVSHVALSARQTNPVS